MEFSIISWNARGLGKMEKHRGVRDLVIRQKPKILLLQETKLPDFGPSLLRRLGCYGRFEYINSPSIGSAGGLISFWDPSYVNIYDSLVHQRFIVLFGKICGLETSFGFINIYGPSVEAEKGDFFSELLNIILSYQVVWCLGGDFNMYCSGNEKLGARPNISSMELFRSFINNAHVCDLPLNGGLFTWSNNREEPSFARLDRFLVEPNFLSIFQGLVQSLLSKGLSDHNAILLKNQSYNWGARPFKLFNYLMEEHGFEEVVLNSLSKAKVTNGRIGILGLLKNCKAGIKAWSSANQFGKASACAEIESKISSLEGAVQLGPAGSNAGKELVALRKELWMQSRREERIWLQNSRLKWFAEGDKNTRFFHLVASNRRRSNSIHSLLIDGNLVSEPKRIKDHIFSHFEAAYNAKNTLEIDKIELDFKKISEAQKDILEKNFSEEEVWVAISSFDNSSAPGPDGFNTGFFKKYWAVLKVDLMKFFLISTKADHGRRE
ncbi:hypothetical protein HRI_003166300 [Hibiscus trionum]|uniref:Endonuclease/exonuclease/phosphatase domain-containing protein n=1 Tax=Hibiscus trionum TaxID=183268 RepID=A0A9W7ME69_HIBTR|nr:hypothetical protein HRI_003166300 [Hibiscus trionum]